MTDLRTMINISILLISSNVFAHPFYFESDRMFMNLPYGGRQNAMGGTGTALADDETTLYYNPAGLARDNERFKSGALSMSHEQLCPELGIADMQVANYSLVYKPNKLNIGGFGLSFTHSDELWENNEIEIGLSHSFNLRSWNSERHYFGYSIKYLHKNFNFEIYSDLEDSYIYDQDTNVPQKISDYANTFAVDLGYVFDISPEFHFGLTAKNIGPDTKVPVTNYKLFLPSSFNAAIAYTGKFDVLKRRKLIFNGEIRLEREFFGSISDEIEFLTVKENLQRIILHEGVELGVENMVFLRFGHLYDYWGYRNELRWGLGVNILKHICIDYYRTHAPESDKNTGIIDNQWGLTLSFYEMLNWLQNGR